MPQTHDKVNDAIRAERIAIKAGDISKGRLTQGSSRHRIQNIILKDNAFCIIELPLVGARK